MHTSLFFVGLSFSFLLSLLFFLLLSFFSFLSFSFLPFFFIKKKTPRYARCFYFFRADFFAFFFRFEFLVSTMSWFGFGSKEEPIDEDACRAVRLLFRTNQCCPGLRVVPWNYTPHCTSLFLYQPPFIFQRKLGA